MGRSNPSIVVFCVKSAWISFVFSYRVWSCLTTSRTSVNALSSNSSAPRNGAGKRVHAQTHTSPTLTRPDGVAEVLSTARVHRAPSERTRCASTESTLATSNPLTLRTIHVQFNFLIIPIVMGVKGYCHCAHRTSTALSCAFCEHSSDPPSPSRLLCSHRATPPNDLSSSIATSRAHETICLHLLDHPSRPRVAHP